MNKQNEFSNILSNARHNLIKNLDIGINYGYGSSVHETVQPLFPSLIKCQLLSDLQNAWNLKSINNNNNNNSENNNIIYVKPALIHPLFGFESFWNGKHFFEIFHPPNLIND